jgi:hypothetical protein
LAEVRPTLDAVGAAQPPAVALASGLPWVPTVAPGSSPAGYIPLDLVGVTPTPIGDEQIINLDVPAFEYAGQTWTSIGVASNGYLVVGGGTAEDNNCCHLPSGPSPARPNNILAPFWTNLDGTDAPGIFAGIITNSVNDWFVIEFRLNVFGTTSLRVFQVWIGINGVEDITYAYDPANLPGDPVGQDFLVGAENALGQGDMAAVLPTEDLRVVSVEPSFAQVWIGLKNSDAVGLRLDVKAEVRLNADLIGTGQLDNVAGGSSGFNNAKLHSIILSPVEAVELASGDTVSVTLSVRRTCAGGGHNSGTARLWFNDSQANSGVSLTIEDTPQEFFLRTGFALATTPGSGPKQTSDVSVDSKAPCPARPFKPFGTWSLTVP